MASKIILLLPYLMRYKINVPTWYVLHKFNKIRLRAITSDIKILCPKK